MVKEFGPIDYIDFSPVEPYYFAVTCSVRVQVYNPITKLVAKNLSRFRENAYGASFRSDGRLLCSGGEETNVKLFDINTKSLLRIFKGHTAPVHRTFFTQDKLHIASFSDDKSVKLWDIATEKSVHSYSDHTDYIRAGAISPVVPDIVLSGSYDNTVKMYDTRTDATVLSVDHGSPIESLLFLPSGGMFLSAGGTDIKVWDAFAGGKLLANFSSHHKTITCMHLASNNKRLMSGSLDRHVKIYDIATFKVVHTLDFPNAVLSLAASKNDDTIVAGMVDGLVSIQRRELEMKPTKAERKMVSYKYISHASKAPTVNEVIPEKLRETQAKYDTCFRKFQFTKALDTVMIPYTINKNPTVVVSVLQELMKRKALQKALVGRDTKSLTQILRFLIKYISDYRFTRTLIDVTHILLDVYEHTIHLQSAEVGKIFITLAKRLREEQELGEQLAHLQGALQLLLAGASASDHINNTQTTPAMHNLIPSADAQKNLVVNLT